MLGRCHREEWGWGREGKTKERGEKERRSRTYTSFKKQGLGTTETGSVGLKVGWTPRLGERLSTAGETNGRVQPATRRVDAYVSCKTSS